MINLQPQIKYDIWKPLYYWVLEGKWRRWCIPGAIISMASFWLTVIFISNLSNYPNAQVLIRGFIFGLLEPLRFLFESKYPYQKLVLIVALHIWLAILGAAAAYVLGFFWKLVIRKPQSENCNIEKIEIIEL